MDKITNLVIFMGIARDKGIFDPQMMMEIMEMMIMMKMMMMMLMMMIVMIIMIMVDMKMITITSYKPHIPKSRINLTP